MKSDAKNTSALPCLSKPLDREVVRSMSGVFYAGLWWPTVPRLNGWWAAAPYTPTGRADQRKNWAFRTREAPSHTSPEQAQVLRTETYQFPESFNFSQPNFLAATSMQ